MVPWLSPVLVMYLILCAALVVGTVILIYGWGN